MKKLTYKHSGVDVKKGENFVAKIKPLVKKTYRPGVLQGLGGFGALFQVNFRKYKNPVLVSSTDGVGTKLKVAQMANRHDTIGIDLVAMSVNDLLAMGAEPLFFLDYYATSSLNVKVAIQVMKGIVKGCQQAGCALIGGETAEMPDVFKKGEYELAGFAVGIVEKNKIIDGRNINANDVLIGLSSSGLHSNGYSLARKVYFEILKYKKVPHALLTPTKIYVKTILPLLKRFKIHGMVHVTGGGLTQNIPRILPSGYSVEISNKSWKRPSLFDFIQSKGNISETEMLKTFNCGIGYVLIAPASQASRILAALKKVKQSATLIGKVIKKRGNTVVYK